MPSVTRFPSPSVQTRSVSAATTRPALTAHTMRVVRTAVPRPAWAAGDAQRAADVTDELGRIGRRDAPEAHDAQRRSQERAQRLRRDVLRARPSFPEPDGRRRQRWVELSDERRELLSGRDAAAHAREVASSPKRPETRRRRPQVEVAPGPADASAPVSPRRARRRSVRELGREELTFGGAQDEVRSAAGRSDRERRAMFLGLVAFLTLRTHAQLVGRGAERSAPQRHAIVRARAWHDTSTEAHRIDCDRDPPHMLQLCAGRSHDAARVAAGRPGGGRDLHGLRRDVVAHRRPARGRASPSRGPRKRSRRSPRASDSSRSSPDGRSRT